MTDKISVLYLYEDGDAGCTVSNSLAKAGKTIFEVTQTYKVVGMSGFIRIPDGRSMAFELGQPKAGFKSALVIEEHLTKMRDYTFDPKRWPNRSPIWSENKQ